MKKICTLIITVISLFLITTTHAKALAIYYDYNNKIAFSIADSAKAYINKSTLVGEAKALRIVKTKKGPNNIEVEVTHYNRNGEKIYKGIVEFSLGFMSGVVKEKTISGRKRYSIFTSWPSGR